MTNDLNFSEEKKSESGALKEATYYVKGMHCASCEVLIEKRLLKKENIKSVEASVSQGRVTMEYTGGKLTLAEINKIFKEDNYSFFDAPISSEQAPRSGGFFRNFFWAFVIIILFLFLNKSSFSSVINVSSSSSLFAFFMLGILAGCSACAALVGGLVLSMSKQWFSLYSVKATWKEKMQPHLMFNAGRILSYGILGALLGKIGGGLQVSASLASVLVIVISFLMLFLGLQMLGLKALKNFQVTMPKFITRRVADETKFKGKQMPFIMGALTFFLPCGFTLTAQGLALLSGNAWQGGLIMAFFALGTAPSLLLIGLSSVKIASKPHLTGQFLKTAGVLVLFFGLFNVNSQFNALGIPSLNDLGKRIVNSRQTVRSESDLPPIINGKQVIRMKASSSGYVPDYFKVRAGVPVRWEIKDVGTSGCTNAVLARGLFTGQISLQPGKTSIKEFTPKKAGRYKFSCWMGMVNGIIDVVE